MSCNMRLPRSTNGLIYLFRYYCYFITLVIEIRLFDNYLFAIVYVNKCLPPQLYMEDAFGERIWIDDECAQPFVDNVLTAFPSKGVKPVLLLQSISSDHLAMKKTNLSEEAQKKRKFLDFAQQPQQHHTASSAQTQTTATTQSQPKALDAMEG